MARRETGRTEESDALASLWKRGAASGEGFVEGYAARDAIVRVGAMLRRMREDAGLTQTELAQRAAMDQSEISRLERGLGRHGPSVETLARVTEALGHALVVGARPIRDDADGEFGTPARRAARSWDAGLDYHTAS